MKKSAIFSVFITVLFLVCTSTSFSQLEVDSNGKASIGPYSPSPSYNLRTGSIRADYYETINCYSTCLKTCGTIYFSFPYVGMYFGQGSMYYESSLYPEINNNCQIGKSDKGFKDIYYYNLHQLSDIRQKENIREVQNALGLITLLNGVQYDLRKEYAYQDTIPLNASLIEKLEKERKDIYGFIAQDVEEVLPSVVFHDDSTDVYTIDYTKIIPICVNAIKEQQQLIIQLQEEVANLKAGDSKGVSMLSGVNDRSGVPVAELFQNNPNPFDERTIIKFSIPSIESYAAVNIYDLQGAQVRNFKISITGPGKVEIPASELTPGIYIYNLIVDDKVIDTKQMILTN